MTRTPSFGELRSLMMEAPRGPDWSGRLWELLERTWHADPAGYTREWVRYLTSFEEIWQEGPLARLTSWEALERACQIAPFASFELELDGQDLGDEALVELASRPQMRHLTHLGLASHDLSWRSAQALADSEQLRGLRSLDLSFSQIGPEGVRALLSRPWQALHTLHLRWAGLRNAGAVALAQASGLEGLRELTLSSNQIGPSGLGALAESRQLEQLRGLGVSFNPLGPAGIGAFAEAARMPRLTWLELESTRMGPRGADALARAGGLGGVRHLKLSANEFGPAGAHALASAEHFEALAVLELAHNRLRNPGVVALAGARWMRGLKALELGHNHLQGGGGTEALARHGRLASLERLGLAGNDLGVQGARALALAPWLSGLSRLDVKNCHIEAGGLAALLEGVGQGLEELILQGNLLGDAGALELGRARQLVGLVRLDVSVNHIMDEGARALVGSSWFGGLAYLDMAYNELRDGACLKLARYPAIQASLRDAAGRLP